MPRSPAATPTTPTRSAAPRPGSRGTTEDDLRAAILARTTTWEGSAYAWPEQVGMFRRQTAKNVRAVRDTLRHRVLHQGTGRDLGYPR